MAAGVLSAVIVWCNVTVGISSSLSPLYQLIAWTEHEFFSQVCSDHGSVCSSHLSVSSVSNLWSSHLGCSNT